MHTKYSRLCAACFFNKKEKKEYETDSWALSCPSLLLYFVDGRGGNEGRVEILNEKLLER
jgi:hypothetical protein